MASEEYLEGYCPNCKRRRTFRRQERTAVLVVGALIVGFGVYGGVWGALGAMVGSLLGGLAIVLALVVLFNLVGVSSSTCTSCGHQTRFVRQR